MSELAFLMGEYLADTRAQLLPVLLEHAGKHGWNQKMLDAALKDKAIEPTLYLRAFPDGIADVMRYWFVSGDVALRQFAETMTLDDMRIRDRIALLVKKRIIQHEGQKEAVRHAMVWLAMPNHVPLSLSIGYDTVDNLWRLAGDRSTDFSFYTRRLSLGGVYKSTLLYWLGDKSEESKDSWAFLGRRIENAMQIHQFRSQCKRVFDNLPFKEKETAA